MFVPARSQHRLIPLLLPHVSIMKRSLATFTESEIMGEAEARALQTLCVFELKEMQHLKKSARNCSQPALAVMQRLQLPQVDDVEDVKEITEEDLFGPASDSEDLRG